MASIPLEAKCIWHPDWSEVSKNSAGAFVHFRKQISIDLVPSEPILVDISADTKYKLYINSKLVYMGPVKGDEQMWFYDTVDIQPYLKHGVNNFSVRVLRLYYATPYATSFPRLPFPGLFLRYSNELPGLDCDSSILSEWETCLDLSTRLPTSLREDDFLHIYEDVENARNFELRWVQAKLISFHFSHGISPPWKMSSRLIPPPRYEPAYFKDIHNVSSSISVEDLKQLLISGRTSEAGRAIHFPAGTSHHFEVEANEHLTAMLSFRFQRPSVPGSILRITYAECYEDDPPSIPYLRRKSDRCDIQKRLMGPEDVFVFGGRSSESDSAVLAYDVNIKDEETYNPFHFRTLRFIALDIKVAEGAELVMKGIDMNLANYPLDVIATFKPGQSRAESNGLYSQMWDVGLRTLRNCMHDCYEDCPFYEQLQYAMDTRSSILFTYSVSGDDKLARQAIIQLHNSYQSDSGLTASRAPSHQRQTIPHFSLYWVCMLSDHLAHFNDKDFIRQFIPACDGVLEHFSRRIDPELGLVRYSNSPDHWEFVDWTNEWRPLGTPPAAIRTNFCTYTNMLYAYSLQRAVALVQGIGRPSLATEYQSRADSIILALRAHCFDGSFFTDGLASKVDASHDYSEHSQVWAVLCGASEAEEATLILSRSLSSRGDRTNLPTELDSSKWPEKFTPSSVAMSFYVLRALSDAGGTLYDDLFHSFWEPWREQLSLNLTTWEEDTVSQRSDCHAWGCAALYEFAREVAGVRPGKDGWATIDFRPRLRLFRELDAQVPFGSSTAAEGGIRAGIALVTWQTYDNGNVRLSLRLKFQGGNSGSPGAVPLVKITLPNGEVEVVQDSSLEIIRCFKL